jgi:outer membrane autotransporter protein
MASSYNKLTAEQVRANYHQQFFVADLQPPAGRNFNLGEGKVVQPYVRAAYVHEFAKNNEVKVNDNVFNNDLSGARGELGTGIAMTLTDKVSLHADVDYSNGDKIEQPWGFNVGARYSW